MGEWIILFFPVSPLNWWNIIEIKDESLHFCFALSFLFPGLVVDGGNGITGGISLESPGMGGPVTPGILYMYRLVITWINNRLTVSKYHLRII